MHVFTSSTASAENIPTYSIQKCCKRLFFFFFCKLLKMHALPGKLVSVSVAVHKSLLFLRGAMQPRCKNTMGILKMSCTSKLHFPALCFRGFVGTLSGVGFVLCHFRAQKKYRFSGPTTSNDPHCLAPMVWAFLSTTVQLPATQRKVFPVFAGFWCPADNICIS
jgi:hypothetical protein